MDSPIIMEGKTLAKTIKLQAANDITDLKDVGIYPGLAVISVGDNPASKTYIKNKEKACKEVGIVFYHYILPKNTTQTELEDVIDDLNGTRTVSGIILQLPIPKHLNEYRAISHITPRKDVDGLSILNAGMLALNSNAHYFTPCTATGIVDLLRYYHIDLEGKHVVVVGRSNLVGKPLAQLMLHENATVTVCHSKTTDLSNHTRQADILVCAVGKPNFITADIVKENAVVVDVGINHIDGKLCGDVDFENVKNKVSHITPVPGGVGPMTVAKLISNVVDAEYSKFHNNTP